MEVSTLIAVKLTLYFFSLLLSLFLGTRQKASDLYLFWSLLIIGSIQGLLGFLLFFSLMDIQPAWIPAMAIVLFFDAVIAAVRDVMIRRKNKQ